MVGSMVRSYWARCCMRAWQDTLPWLGWQDRGRALTALCVPLASFAIALWSEPRGASLWMDVLRPGIWSVVSPIGLAILVFLMNLFATPARIDHDCALEATAAERERRELREALVVQAQRQDEADRYATHLQHGYKLLTRWRNAPLSDERAMASHEARNSWLTHVVHDLRGGFGDAVAIGRFNFPQPAVPIGTSEIAEHEARLRALAGIIRDLSSGELSRRTAAVSPPHPDRHLAPAVNGST